MALVDSISSLAKSVIAQHGAAATLTKVTASSYNASTSEATKSSTSASISGVMENYSYHLVDGTRIKQGDQKVLIAARDLSFIPEAGDTVTIGGAVWTVVSVLTNFYKDVSVSYELQVRK